MAYTYGKGTAVKFAISGTQTAVPQATNITGPSQEMGQIETTHLASTTHEYMPDKLPEGGELAFTIEWDPANSVHAQLRTNFAAATAVVWNVVYADPGPTTDSFSGFITKFPMGEAQVTEKMTMDITVKIAGAIVTTVGS